MFYFSNIDKYPQYYTAAKKALWEVHRYDPDVVLVCPGGSSVIYPERSNDSDFDFAAYGTKPDNRLVVCGTEQTKKGSVDIYYYNIIKKIDSSFILSDNPMQHPYSMYHWFLVNLFSGHIVHMTQTGSIIYDYRSLFLFREAVENSLSYVEKTHSMIESRSGIWLTDTAWKQDFENHGYAAKFAKMNLYVMRLIIGILQTGTVCVMQERDSCHPLDTYYKNYACLMNQIEKLDIGKIGIIKKQELQQVKELLVSVV